MTSRLQIHPATSAARDGTALGLVRLPFVFTQDGLLTTEGFIEEAERRGHRLTLDILSDLHAIGLLKPLYRISNSSVGGRRIPTPQMGEMNPRGWVFDAARDGRLREVADEGRSVWEPYHRPSDESDYRWWNGFVYSSWQLLDVRHVLSDYEARKRGWSYESSRTRSDRCLVRTLALCALSTRHLPSVLGHYSIPGGHDGEALWRSRFDIGDRERLALARFDAQQLRPYAEQLLSEAHSADPMIEWLPLLRHASRAGWQKLKGEPLDCHWKRVAAELLLRAHDALAEDGDLEPLPEPEMPGWWTPLHDRLAARGAATDSLERALGSFGLSPHPRVVLLVEGETEMIHIPRLLSIFDLDRPDRVRVLDGGGSKVNPHLIARYAISPRIGPAWGGQQFLDATPTALVVAMDPENRWATVKDRNNERDKLQRAIREEVRRQGADITDMDLEFLVRVFVWGDQSYELENFTDAELAAALIELAGEQGKPGVTTAEWRQDALQAFANARLQRQDAGVAIGQMRVRVDKPRFAELLWPTLLRKVEATQPMPHEHTPVHELVLLVREVVGRLSASGYVLDQPGTNPR